MILRRGVALLSAMALMLCLLPLTARADNQPTLVLTGNPPNDVAANLHALVDPGRYSCHPGPAQKALIRRQVDDNSRQALQALGYYQPVLVQHWKDAGKDHCFELTLDVNPGQATRIEKLDIQLHGDARQDPAFQHVIDQARLAPGERLRQNRYETLKRNLQQLLINHGYAQGRLTAHRLQVNRDRHTATVVLHVDSGPRYRFGSVTLTGNPELKKSLLRGYLRFHSGEPFSNEKLLATQQAYLGANYFSAVQVERGKPDTEHHTIDVVLRFSPRHEWALRAGIGISTDTGPRLRLGVENRRLNSAGHTARAETELSSVRQGVGASYQIPLSDPVNEKLDLHTSYLKEQTDTSNSESLSLGADYIIRTQSGWVVTPSIEYLHEIYQVADQTDQADLVIPGFQLTRVKADDRVHPQFGWRLGFKVRAASQAVLSSTTFVQYDTWGKLILPVPVIGGRLITRGEAGLTQVPSVRDLPASLRFFAGGDSSVRGFAYESLGPTNDQGDVIGGRNLLVSSVEYDHPISESWSLAVFSDAGNAFNDFNNYDIVRSAGFGVRWNSPLGPVRVDLARGLSAGQSWRLHLSMGPDL